MKLALRFAVLTFVLVFTACFIGEAPHPGDPGYGTTPDGGTLPDASARPG